MKIRRSLLSAVVTASIISPALSSCSKAGEQKAPEQNASVQTAGGPAVPEQDANTQDQSAQNAKALLKSMSDYLAAQKNISMDYRLDFRGSQQGSPEAPDRDLWNRRPQPAGQDPRDPQDPASPTPRWFYDGKTLTLLRQGQERLRPGRCAGNDRQSVIDQLRDKFHRQLPAPTCCSRVSMIS